MNPKHQPGPPMTLGNLREQAPHCHSRDSYGLAARWQHLAVPSAGA